MFMLAAKLALSTAAATLPPSHILHWKLVETHEICNVVFFCSKKKASMIKSRTN